MPVISVNVLTGEISQREMTAEEIAAIPPAPPRNIPAEIDALERQHQLPRPTREFMLVYMEIEAGKAGLTIDQLKAANSGYRRVKELDDQIRALRGLL